MYFIDEKHKKNFSLLLVCNIISLITFEIDHIRVLDQYPLLHGINILFLSVSFYLEEIYFAMFVLADIKETDQCDRIIGYSIHTAAMAGMIIWVLPEFGIIDLNRSPLFLLGQVPGWAVTILIITLILKNKKRLGHKATFLYLLYLSIPMIGMIMRNVTGIPGLQHFSTTVALLLIHTIVNTEQSRELQEQQRKNEVNKNRIMLTQLKPHFIYNSLNTIYYLCEKDPKEAQKAIDQFSSYLRGNLDSLTTDALIPFQKELEHIHHYLYLEKLRFADELNTEMHISCTDFKVPSLSIQLLVENAIKHGIGHKPGGGTVIIETEEDDSGYIVRVSDDGIGFDPNRNYSDDDSRSHIGLESMKERVQNAGGSVEIQSADGKGTQVTVKIPKQPV